jgi:branched-subunit amino acid ABC-type transport system permease component
VLGVPLMLFALIATVVGGMGSLIGAVVTRRTAHL